MPFHAKLFPIFLKVFFSHESVSLKKVTGKIGTLLA
jgi:hypothetical protein